MAGDLYCRGVCLIIFLRSDTLVVYRSDTQIGSKRSRF